MTKQTLRPLVGEQNDAIAIRLGAHDPTRNIPASTQCMLWGKAAGRCEFAGCNRPLWKSSVTQESVNLAHKAHIYSFSALGPRGNEGLGKEELNDIGNLMLLCHECHRKVDKENDGGRFTAALLRRMKGDHERRIELIAGIAEGTKSHILLYAANIGDHSSPLSYGEAALALFPLRYPATDVPIELGTVNSGISDKNEEFWSAETTSLRRKFDQRVKERLAVGEIEHLSVFSLAPQPLLVLLGTLLGDIVPSDIYQRHREPPTWEWPANMLSQAFEVREPSAISGPPAIVLALSATVRKERITSILGLDASIWTVTVPHPHNDMLKSREQLSQFRSLLRLVFNQINAAYGQSTLLHVFPVAPVAAAIEFGRVRMPKADMSWLIYDQVSALGGFIPAVSISLGEGQ